jgi:hypothetical protein
MEGGMPGRYPNEEDEKGQSSNRSESAVVDLEAYRKTGKIVDVSVQTRLKTADRSSLDTPHKPVD